MHDQDWPFDQPRNCAAITLRSIIFDDKPILYVVHDEEDHVWQFLDLDDVDEANAAVVSVEEIVKRDPSINQLADLPPGWYAWRQSVDHDWHRAPKASA